MSLKREREDENLCDLLVVLGVHRYKWQWFESDVISVHTTLVQRTPTENSGSAEICFPRCQQHTMLS